MYSMTHDGKIKLDVEDLRMVDWLTKISHPNIILTKYVAPMSFLLPFYSELSQLTPNHHQQIRNAVSYLHFNGMYHGDITAGNIFVDNGGNAVLGLPKLLSYDITSMQQQDLKDLSILFGSEI